MEHWQYNLSLIILRMARLSAIAAVCLLLPSCRKAATNTTVPQQPPPPRPIVVPRKSAPKKDVNLPAAPPIASKAPENTPVTLETNPPVLQPPAAKKRRPPKVAKKSPDVKPVPRLAADEAKPVATDAKPEAAAILQPPAQPEAAAGTPPSQPPSSPKLGQMLTEQEGRQYNKRLDTTLERVRGAVFTIQSKLLTDDQKEIVGRIRSFLAQAEQAREQDLVSAVNLAERADLLSRDLLERLH